MFHLYHYLTVLRQSFYSRFYVSVSFTVLLLTVNGFRIGEPWFILPLHHYLAVLMHTTRLQQCMTSFRSDGLMGSGMADARFKSYLQQNIFCWINEPAECRFSQGCRRTWRCHHAWLLYQCWERYGWRLLCSGVWRGLLWLQFTDSIFAVKK